MELVIVDLLEIKEKKIKFEKLIDNEYENGKAFLFFYIDYKGRRSIRISSIYKRSYIQEIVKKNKDKVHELLNCWPYMEEVAYVKCTKERIKTVEKCMEYFQNGGIKRYINSEFYDDVKDKTYDNLVEAKYYYDDNESEIINAFVCDINYIENVATILIASDSFFNDEIKPGVFMDVKIVNSELVIEKK